MMKKRVKLDPVNEFYYQELMNIILRRLYNAPMWNGFYINDTLVKTSTITKTRITNNYVL